MRQTVLQNDILAAVATQDALGVVVALPYVGVVVVEGDRLVAAFIFNNFDRVNVDVSITILAPLRVRALREIALYAFGTLRVKRVTCTTEATNYRAVNRLLAMGFEFEGTMRARFLSGDGLVFGLLASDQKLVRLTVEHPPSPGPCSDSERANRFERTDGAISAVA